MGFVIRNGKLVQEQDKSGRQAFGGEAVEWLVGRELLIGERGADGGNCFDCCQSRPNNFDYLRYASRIN